VQSIIGPNSALRYLKSYNAHADYWHEVNPAYLLAYVDKKEHTSYIQDYAASFPDSMVVARIHHALDGGFHLKPTGPNDNRHYVASPEDYIKDYGFLGHISNVILNVFNEPDGFADDATIDRLISWFLEYIPLAVNSKTKSLLFNWGDRQPRIFGDMMDARYGGILKLAALYPELFYMGMHLYGPDDITQHLESYVKLCETLEIKPLRVIASEFGFDKTNGAASGYKSRGVGGGEYAAWQISQVQHDLSPYIKSGVLVGLNVFQEGNSGGWAAFDYENDDAYKKELKRAAQAGELDMLARDIQFGKLYRLNAPGKIVTAYVAPSIGDRRLGTIPDNAIVEVVDRLMVDGETWLKVKYRAFSGVGCIKVDLVSLRQTMEMEAVKVDDLTADTKPLPALPEAPQTNAPEVLATTTHESIPNTPKTPQMPTSRDLTASQIGMLDQWRGQLQFEIKKHQAEIDMCTERLAFIDRILEVQSIGV